MKKPPTRMTGKQYDDAITRLGLTQIAAARFFKIGDRTSRRYVAGGKIPYSTVMLLHVMLEEKISPQQLGFEG